jgi:hypothetical protein
MSADISHDLEVAALLAGAAEAGAQPCGNPACERVHGAALLEAAIIILCENARNPLASLNTTILALQRTRDRLAQRAPKGPPS